MEKSNTLCIIPARAGSKGLPGKNTKLLGGKPLVEWSLEAAKESGVCGRIILASDGENIRAIGEHMGVETISLPESVTTDASPLRDAINHVLHELSANGYEPEWLLVLQPTSPLRTGIHVREAIAKLAERQAKGVISVCEISNKPLKAFIVNREGLLIGLGGEVNFTNMTRAQLPPLYMPNGAIYFIKRDLYEEVNNFFIDKSILPYVMGEDVSIDIDTAEDFMHAEKIIART